MNKIKFQFDNDKPFEVGDIEDNQPYTLTLQKTNAKIGEGVTVKQDSNILEFTDGKRTFKLFIE